MSTLLIEPFGGFAGDMFLAALLDLGDPRWRLADLEALAAKLLPGECRLELNRVQRGSFVGQHLTLQTTESENPPHRHLSHLRELVFEADLPSSVQQRSYRALQALAEAEGRVHGIEPDRVHFHEVGAVDTLIDICGALLALERLGVTRVLGTPPLTGEGSVHCAHGEMPVPVPAVVELFRGRPLRLGGGDGERLTPTGAALLVELVEDFEMPGEFSMQAVGMGAGTRDPQTGPANMVRVQLGSAPLHQAPGAQVDCLEVNLDDASGEEIGWCLKGLRAAGALDVWCTAVQMKKGRPGVQISALCRASERVALEAVIFERTQSLGLRWTQATRVECERRVETLEVDGLSVRLKLRLRPAYPGSTPFGPRDVSPEFDDLQQLAEQQQLSIGEAHERVLTRYFTKSRS